jgi:hypothetical protein
VRTPSDDKRIAVINESVKSIFRILAPIF